ncbi:MAG: class I SAM-dependent methyltransferase, partial [Burkholderiaceae bacterium]
MNSSVNQPLEFTGERYFPSIRGDIELEHTHRYMLAAEFVAGKHVLDIASGEGYGSAYLSRFAKQVIGVDIDSSAVEHARKKYVIPNLEYKQGDCKAIPLPDASVEIVVSFETIEHHTAHDEMMAEIKRVLKPGGVLIISSPDKAQYSDKHGTKNEYHVRELYQDEFDDLLARYFSSHLILGQRIAYGSLLVGPQQQQTEFISYQHGSQTELRASGLPEPIYLIAFASDEALPPVPNSAYITDSPGNQPEMEYLRSRLESRAALIRDLGSRMTGVATALSENKSEICGLDTHLHDLSDDPASEGILSKGLTDLARQITTLCERNAELLARIEALEQTQEAAQRERELEQRKRDLEQQEHEERREIERQRVERIAAESAARQAADHAQIEHLSQR